VYPIKGFVLLGATDIVEDAKARSAPSLLVERPLVLRLFSLSHHMQASLD